MIDSGLTAGGEGGEIEGGKKGIDEEEEADDGEEEYIS